MKLLGATMIWVWWCVTILMAVTTSSAAVEQQLGFTTVTFGFDKTKYDQFLNTLRNAVGGTRSCDLLSTKSNPTTTTAYVLVKLQISSTKWVTLGIEAKNLYVWAYQDKINGKLRATFLKDADEAARRNLFSGSTERNTSFGGNYQSLESAAQTTRETIPLTFEGLKSDTEGVYGESAPVRKSEATFFLRAIQMVAEAARFRFIQKAIRDGTAGPGVFRQKLVAYENSWDKISQAIHTASPRCEEITPTLIISPTIIIKNVNEIRNDIGILKYKTSTLSTIATSLMDDDHQAAFVILESALY